MKKKNEDTTDLFFYYIKIFPQVAMKLFSIYSKQQKITNDIFNSQRSVLMWPSSSYMSINTCKEAPYLKVMGELWGTYCEDCEENWPCYNSTSLTPTSIVTDIDETDQQIYSE